MFVSACECAISVRCLLPLVLHLPILIVLTEPEQTLSNSLLRSAPKCTTTIAGMHEYRKYTVIVPISAELSIN